MALADALRRVPLGILLMAALLAMVGLGSMAGGLYFFLASGSLSLWAAGIALVTGPVSLYLVYHLLRLEPWTWTVLVVLVALLFLSSIARIVVSPSPVTPIVEILVELALAFYLTRPAQRAAFGRAEPGGAVTE